MTQDYARKPRSSRNPGARPRAGGDAAAPGAPRTGAFLGGFATGLLTAFLVYLLQWLPAPGDEQAGPAAGAADDQPPAGVRFEFPDVLRQAEVLVPYVEEYLQPEAQAEEEGVEYLLQAGAFRNPEDADRRRAAVLLLDMEARTLRVSRDGQAWHRVLVGPFPNRSAVRDAQLQLLEEEIDSIVLRSTSGGA